jgi:opacity protein-like surface antigen
VITTNDGGEHIGYIITDNGREIELMTEKKGKVFIPKYAIKSMVKLNTDNYKDGVYLFSNPHASRYFYTPSAFALEKGDGYVQTIWFFYYQLQYGITDNFSLGVSTTFLGNPVAITPKYTIKTKKENVNFAIGAQMGTTTWGFGFDNTRPFLGIGYGVMTVGSKENNVTFGGGYAFATFEGESQDGVALALGGSQRVAKSISLMAEFWYGPGVRILREQKNAWDFGFWVVGDDGGVLPIPLPYLSFTWKL